jgi:tetratricopeptide (TPR) repeat protein
MPLRLGVISNCLAAGHYAEAVDGAQAFLGLAPGHWLGHYFLGLALSMEGKHPEATVQLGRAVELSRRNPVALADLARNAVLDGRQEEARDILAELEGASAHAFIPPTTLANALAALGENDRALDWLEKAVEIRDSNLLLLRISPHYRGLHGHPRFESVLERVGLRNGG